MIRNAVRVLAFDWAALVDELDDSRPVSYLFDYLSHAALAAQSIVVEDHYVDRHYLDDFAAYYARAFDAPSPHCSRLHFFASSADEVERVLSGAYESAAGLAKASATMDAAYCGFVVRRPLPGARMGRTVLKTYPVDNRRHYTTVRPYPVNLAGLSLVVHGLAYQQQDGGTAVCASTALWSALQRVARVAGHRTPTPSSITAAAGSPFPASRGLGAIDSATALATLGYAAEYFHADDPALFRTKVVTCLRSQLPVVLNLRLNEERGSGPEHAVTITGYSEPASIVDVVVPDGGTFRCRFGSVETIYVHDDNLGSHAHYEFFEEEGWEGMLKLRRGRGDRPSPAWLTAKKWEEVWFVESAIVPKPQKLRVEVDGILQNILWLQEEFEQFVFPGLAVDYEPRFKSGVDYRSALAQENVDRSKLREFMSALALPRYVGVITLLSEDARLCDVLIDVTEYDRQQGAPAVLGIVAPGVPALSPAHGYLEALCDEFEWLLITAPASPPAPSPAVAVGEPDEQPSDAAASSLE